MLRPAGDGLATEGPILRDRDERAATRGTDPLVVRDGACVLVAESQGALHGDQVVEVHARRECLIASAAAGCLASRADVLVEADADLRRALEDVEELPEGQPEQREDHGD